MRAQIVRSEGGIAAADQFLAKCVRAAITNSPCPPWSFSSCDEDWASIVSERASFHGIAVLLAQAADPFAGWPDHAAKPIVEEMRLAALWEELHRAKLIDLFERLAQGGVEMIVMKGTALAYLHYPDPAARRRGDTDLLIRAKDLAITRRVLEAAGCFARQDPLGLHYQESWLFDGGAGMLHMIDLHWEPVDHSVLQRVVNAHRYWQDRVPITRLSAHVSAPSGLIMLVHGAINQAWHAQRGFYVDGQRLFGNRRLIWSVDYMRITQEYQAADWESLAAYCAAHDASAIMYAALDGARCDLGMEVPDEILVRLAADGANSRTVRYLKNRSLISDFLLNLQAAPSMAKRWRMLARMANPSRAHLDAKYPELAHLPGILLHLRRFFDTLMRLAKGEGRP